MANFELVIFDCDGVLVDSEMLSAGVLMGMMAEVGLPITDENFRSDFLGRSFASAARIIEERFGRPLPDDFQLSYRSRLLKTMRGNLQAMSGVHAMLVALKVPFCLATSSSPERLAVTMTETRLGPYFEGKCYTASLVAHGKPAPDLYLLAAREQGVVPEKCLAIEDSEMGILSAGAAGIPVWHFAGGAHVKAGYRLPQQVVPDRVVDDMAALHQAFAELGLT